MSEYWLLQDVVRTKELLRSWSAQGVLKWPASKALTDRKHHYVDTADEPPQYRVRTVNCARPGGHFKPGHLFEGRAGQKFIIAYQDGCFYPFVFRARQLNI